MMLCNEWRMNIKEMNLHADFVYRYGIDTVMYLLHSLVICYLALEIECYDR